MATINVCFRVDAGPHIGLGHLQRCLSLATALGLQGAVSHFVIREDRAIYSWIAGRGFAVSEIPPNSAPQTDLRLTLNCLERDKAQVLVVDCRTVNHDYLWELRKAGHFVVCIDDLAELVFPSHLVVNGNIYAQELSYRSTTGDTRFLLGTDYVMLRPEFWDVPPRVVRDSVRRILLTLGGMDRHNLMSKLLGLLDDLPGDFGVTAIIGPFFENRREVEKVSRHSQHPLQLIYAPESVRDIMLEADLAVSGGGQTLYELARIGCPAVALQVAPDQQRQLRALVKAGVVHVGTHSSDSDLAEMRGAVLSLLTDRKARGVISAQGQQLVDGQGALRVAETILAETGGLRQRQMLR